MATDNRTPVWELSKENAAPLQRGRNVALLEQSLAETDETRVVKERMVDRYERQVRQSEEDNYNVNQSASASDDPLVLWLGYIKYHQESFPTNTHDQFLLMERCFRALSRFPRYANDVRFIRLCCQYAEKTERPNEIFKYLYQQKIGAETAIFWIAWGFVAEKREEWAFANDIYTKGIKKRAKPTEKLNKRYREFQRRMARHWLNATQTQEDEENPSANRGILGALSEDAVHRNDRSKAHPPGPSFLSRTVQESTHENRINTFVDRSASSRPQHTSNQPSEAAFPIFVEDGGSSTDPLDSSLLHGDVPYRQLEREQDRKKENVHTAERWNERGGYAPTYGQARKATNPRTTNPPPFAVYVDEECAEQQRKIEAQKVREDEVHKRVRDERTFREREDLCVGDALFKDPLRYVRDPSQFEADQRVRNQSTVSKVDGPVAARKANAGFSTRLLRHPDTGEEQNFEEARAIARYFKLVPSSENVNHLVTPDHTDHMSMGGASEEDDISMTDSASIPPVPHKNHRLERKPLSISQNRSVDIPTPRNTSTASSTVEETGVGSLALADPTINTQIAMKELSMMFSSPAIGLNESSSGPLNRSGGLGPILNQSGVSEQADDGSMVAINEEQAWDDGRFQVFDENADASKSASFAICNDESDKKPAVKENSTAFAIYDDTGDNYGHGDESLRQQTCSMTANRPPAPAFSIYSEVDGEGTEKTSPSRGFGIYDESAQESQERDLLGLRAPDHNPQSKSGFIVHHDTVESRPPKRAFDVHFGGSEEEKIRYSGSGPVSSLCQDEDATEVEEDGGGDTATLSLFDEAMSILDEVEGSSHKRRGDSVNIGVTKRRKSNAISNVFDETESFGDISCILPNEDTTEALPPVILSGAVDYEINRKNDMKSAIQRLSSKSVSFPKNRKSLEKILTTEKFVCNLPSHVLPHNLRLQKSAVASGTGIVLGRSSASVKRELGRGAYGCVLLLESEGNQSDAKAAVKAQSPVGSLAWEYEILERLRDRFRSKFGESKRVPFPAPLSFVSLADGALLTMEAVSTSGLNFIDLINVHRQIRGEPALPEILAIHYVSRMLEALEHLHWFGNVLHCDTKADNWVLSTSNLVDGEAIEASDIMLTDFGRAVDLRALDTPTGNPLDNRLKGKASREDMMCVAMKRGLPWSFDVDTYGLCDTAHVLLFGCSLELCWNEKTGRWGPKQPPRRYHQSNLWTRLFDSLLNIEEPSKAAIGSRPGSLRQVRSEFEKYLSDNQTQVKAQLKHQATFLPSKRSSGSPR